MIKPTISRELMITEGIEVSIERKRMKTMRLRVKAPFGKVHLSAPPHVGKAELLSFVRSNLGWIAEQRRKMAEAKPTPIPLYVNGERVMVWGRELRVRVEEGRGAANASIEGDELLIRAKPGAETEGRRKAVEAFYKKELLRELSALLPRWERTLGVKAARIGARKMKTKWGSCALRAKTIVLNTELAKRSPACFEGVLVHELCHLLEASHGPRFKALMDRFLPDWRERKKLLEGRAS